MIPVVALVGRPNVGKSTLFNRLTRTRDALVAGMPGLTRDRQYGRGVIGGRDYVVIDTGGLSGETEGIDRFMAEQSKLAIEEADYVLLMVDAREGRNPGDEEIAGLLRGAGRQVAVLANKIDGSNHDFAISEFSALGFGDPHLISALKGHGVVGAMTALLERCPVDSAPAHEDPGRAAAEGIKIAVIGRPNVGKSTLINRVVGEERLVVYDEAGTTRDTIYVPFERAGERYTLIDTAGVRRRGKVKQAVEKFSIVKTLEAVNDAHAVVLLIDASENIVEQDLHLLEYAMEAGRVVVIAVNKWDAVGPDERRWVERELDRRLVFADYVRVHHISALRGTGVGQVFRSIEEGYRAATRKLGTPALNRILSDAVASNPPPLVGGRRVKLRYAHGGGSNPPIIIIHGNQVEALPAPYKRYLQHRFAERLDLMGTPVKIEFRQAENPFAGRRNVLSQRQLKKRRRMIRHTRSRRKKG